MKYSEEIYITPSEVMEYLYCPRFIFFMNCLCISQHEEQRYKVLKGREIHEQRAKINRDYLRKKLNCRDKELLVYMTSEKYHIKGIVDEVLILNDSSYAPLDYKFSEYKDWLFRTHKIQSVMYGLLIKEMYQREVKRGYICYIRSKNMIKEIVFKNRDFEEVQEIIDEIFMIIQRGYYPKKTRYLTRCIDCCYKNICV